MLGLLSISLIMPFVSGVLSTSSVVVCLFGSIFMLQSNFSTTQNMMFGMSWPSEIMISLTFFVVLMCNISSMTLSKTYFTLFGVLNLVLLGAFCVNDLLLFYVLFESSLIPILFIILGWGKQPERLQASTYLIIYTVCASLPLLLCLLYYKELYQTSNQILLSYVTSRVSPFLCTLLLLAFLVKLPIFGLHKWLAHAHSEAPTQGSMVLAAILLKLGGFGIMLISRSFQLELNLCLSVFCSLCLWGSLLSSCLCLMQSDLKKYIAYSSVGHMAFICAGLLSLQPCGVSSAVIMMVAHGLSSSALFYLAGMIYLMNNSRMLYHMGGFLSLSPVLSLFLFVLCSLNMGVPPSLNFLGELIVLPSIGSMSFLLLVIVFFTMFMSAAYNLYLYAAVSHGKPCEYVKPHGVISDKDYFILTSHLLPGLLFIKLAVLLS